MRGRSELVDCLAPLGVDRTATKRHLKRRIRRPAPTSAAPGEGWLARARCALTTGDYPTAGYAAWQARHQHGDPAEVCSLLARAQAGQGRFEEAAPLAQQAVQLAPWDTGHHLVLAGIFEDLGNWDAALKCYRDVELLAPGSDAARIGTASVFIQTGRAQAAQNILERIYAHSTDNELAGDYLGLALTEVAAQVAEVRDDNTYFITRQEEIAAMRALLARAAYVASDPELKDGIAGTSKYVEECARRVFLPSRMFGTWRGKAAHALVLGILAGGMAATAIIDEPGAALYVGAPVAVSAVVCALVQYARVPRWKINRWAHERELRERAVVVADA